MTTGGLAPGLDERLPVPPGSARYPAVMLRILRAPGGGPAFRTRVVALLLALGMLLAAAPLLIPMTRWAVGTVVPRRAPSGA